MSAKFKCVSKIFAGIVFALILLTFVITLVKLPPDSFVVFNFESFNFDTNISLNQIKDNVIYYYGELFKGSLGKGNNGLPVWELVKVGFSRSVTLLIGAVTISIVFGIIKGVFDSKKDKHRTSTIRLLPTLLGLSMPDIFVIIVIQSFVVWLHQHGIKILPVAGYRTAAHAILPIVSLSIIPTMYIARVTALSIDNIYGQEYIRTIRGKGGSNLRVIWIHVLRNAIVEIANSFSSIASILISSLLLVEYLFYYPGLTLVMYNNYENRQTDVVIGIAIIIGIIYFIIDLIFKGLKHILEPRTQRE